MLVSLFVNAPMTFVPPLLADTQFVNIVRKDDIFREPTPEELKLYKARIPYFIISCPRESLMDSALLNNEHPLAKTTQAEWLVTLYCQPNSTSIRKEAYIPMDDYLANDAELSQGCQSIFTALEILTECQNEGWQKVVIESGSELCCFSVWTACKLLQLPCEGFEESDYNERRFANASEHAKTIIDTLQQKQNPTPQLGLGSQGHEEESE